MNVIHLLIAATTATTLPIDNDFIPERNISECISALPKPNCGSEARGGPLQYAVLIIVVLALAFIAWRIITTARRKPNPH